jgi:hypothetical protein
MQIYWNLFYDRPQSLEDLFDYEMSHYNRKLTVPVESAIAPFKKIEPLFRHKDEYIDWGRFITEAPRRQRKVV